MLTWLDGLLLCPLQWFVDKVQQHTGLLKFRLEKWALMTSIAGWATVYVFSEQNILLTVLFSMLIALVIGGIYWIEECEAIFLKNGSLVGPMFDAPARLVLLVLYIFISIPAFATDDFADKTMLCANASYLLFIYLNACIPKPPSKSTFRKLYENALWRLNDWLKPAPAFVPIPIDNR